MIHLWSMGPDRKRRAMSVVEVDLDPVFDDEAAENPCLVPRPKASRRRAAAHRKDAESDESPEDGEADESGACHAYDWYVVTEADAKLVKRELMFEQCDSSPQYESSVDVDVRTRLVTRREYSYGKIDRTTEEVAKGIDPVREVETSHESNRGSTLSATRWNSDRFEGEVTSGYDYCKGKAPADAGAEGDSDEPPVQSTAAAVPRISLSPEFVAGDWKTIGLGRCAAFIDGDRHGYTIHGGRGTPADASMRVVISSSDDLFVEVVDDKWVDGAKTWVKDDHLELWAIEEADACIDPTAPRAELKQWGIRLSDGQIFSGMGSPAVAAVKAETVRAGRVTRVKIHLPWSAQSGLLTVVFSDSDDGVHQERLLATSPLEYGRWWTLGKSLDVEGPHDAQTCAAKGGVLVPVSR